MFYGFHVFFKTPDIKMRMFRGGDVNPLTVFGYGFEVVHLLFTQRLAKNGFFAALSQF